MENIKMLFCQQILWSNLTTPLDFITMHLGNISSCSADLSRFDKGFGFADPLKFWDTPKVYIWDTTEMRIWKNHQRISPDWFFFLMHIPCKIQLKLLHLGVTHPGGVRFWGEAAHIATLNEWFYDVSGLLNEVEWSPKDSRISQSKPTVMEVIW